MVTYPRERHSSNPPSDMVNYPSLQELHCFGSVAVPEISRFLGIIIAMYYREHAPPHFHAKYGRARAQFSIADLRIIEGKLPPRVTSLVLEWAFQHREELLENWDLAERKEDLRKVRPLV